MTIRMILMCDEHAAHVSKQAKCVLGVCYLNPCNRHNVIDITVADMVAHTVFAVMLVDKLYMETTLRRGLFGAPISFSC